MIFKIYGSIRSKKNSKRIFSTGRFKRVLPSKAYVEWEKDAQAQIQAQNIGNFFDGPVWIIAKFYYRGPRPDIHGCMESLADCIEGVLINNDSQIESWDQSRIFHDKDNPRTEFEIINFTDEPF